MLDRSREGELDERGGGRARRTRRTRRRALTTTTSPARWCRTIVSFAAPVAGEVAVQLEVVGPERDHGGDGGAVAHEREVRARQLEEEERAGLPRVRRRRGGRGGRAVGQRFPARAPRLTATSMPAHRRIAAVSAVVVVLPAVPVMPMRRPVPALEQQVAEAGDARALRTQPLARAARPRASTRRGRRSSAGPGSRRGRSDGSRRTPRSARSAATVCSSSHRGRPAGRRAPRREEAGQRDRVGAESLGRSRGDHPLAREPAARSGAGEERFQPVDELGLRRDHFGAPRGGPTRPHGRPRGTPAAAPSGAATRRRTSCSDLGRVEIGVRRTRRRRPCRPSDAPSPRSTRSCPLDRGGDVRAPPRTRAWLRSIGSSSGHVLALRHRPGARDPCARRTARRDARAAPRAQHP